MIESPVIRRWQAEANHKLILALLERRFKAVPKDVIKQLGGIQSQKRLKSLCLLASECPDLEVFRAALGS